MRAKNFSTGLRGVLFEARHYARMGQAIWLYGWLVLRQTRQEGTLGFVLGGRPVSYREIESETGFHPRTLERWMRVLRREGYVLTRATPGGVIVRITKAKKYAQGPVEALKQPRNFAGRVDNFAGGRPRDCGAEAEQVLSSQNHRDRICSSFLERKDSNSNSDRHPFPHPRPKTDFQGNASTGKDPFDREKQASFQFSPYTSA